MSRDRQPARLPVVLSTVAALLAGALSSAQARANGGLSQELTSPALASVWSFASGFVLLCIAVVHPAGRAGMRRVLDALRRRRLRPWEVVGGLFGGIFVASQTVAVPRLGVAMFTVALVGGQTVNALMVDRLGLGPAGRAPITPIRAGAALFTFVGVALAATSRGGGHVTFSLPLVLAVLAGAGVALQSALNGRVNRAANSPVATTWLNFGWGSLLLVVLMAFEAATGHFHPDPSPHPTWWSLMGGLLGIFYIGLSVVAVAQLGVLVMTLMLLTGQLVCAVVLDVVAPTTAGGVSPGVVCGVLVVLASAAVAAWSARRG